MYKVRLFVLYFYDVLLSVLVGIWLNFNVVGYEVYLGVCWVYLIMVLFGINGGVVII